ncbi:MAG: hypothetical protein OES21_10890, partial [Myxococcales bacterium]|nr:hypothetical protein [Myxococcales bacterium]
EGLFRVYAVENVNQAMEILCGLPSREAGPDGAFPDGSFNQRVSSRLADLAEKRRKMNGDLESGAEL